MAQRETMHVGEAGMVPLKQRQVPSQKAEEVAKAKVEAAAPTACQWSTTSMSVLFHLAVRAVKEATADWPLEMQI